MCSNRVSEAFLGSLSSADCSAVVSSGDLPFGEGTFAFLLKSGLFGKSSEVERFGKLGKRSGLLSFCVPLISGLLGLGGDISGVEVSFDLDTAVSGKDHRLMEELLALCFGFFHGAGSVKEGEARGKVSSHRGSGSSSDGDGGDEGSHNVLFN